MTSAAATALLLFIWFLFEWPPFIDRLEADEEEFTPPWE